MDKKALTFRLLMVAVAGCIVFYYASNSRYYKHLHEIYAQLSFTANRSAQIILPELSFARVDSIVRLTNTQGSLTTTEIIFRTTVSTKPGPRTTNKSNESVSNTIRASSTVSTLANVTKPIGLGVSIEYAEKMRKHGLESIHIHDFKSRYIIDPVMYDKDIKKVPGKRKTKIISCFNCPGWFIRVGAIFERMRDFRKCPYSECRLDKKGIDKTKADVLLFFPTPKTLPSRPPGQIWTYCSWEAPVHYGVPSPYSKWSDVFNWTMSFRQDADIFAPNNRFAWRAKENLMKDSEYLEFAKSKTKTAVWFVSNCRTQSRRMEYVNRMKNIIDIDIYGRCSDKKCTGKHCMTMLNDTYKFYLSFENSFCEDYVTEKLFRNFDFRLQIIPVARGGFDYQKYVPPNTIVDASKFESPEELAEYLKELAADLPRYTAMLKEKDKLTILNWKYDWCELCERLHKGEKPKTIKDIKSVTHRTGVCWPPKLPKRKTR